MENDTQAGWKSDAKPIPKPKEINANESDINDLMIKKVENND